MVLGKGLCIRLPLRTAAAFWTAGVSANEPPPGHMRGLADATASTMGVRGTFPEVSASVPLTLACCQYIFHVFSPGGVLRGPPCKSLALWSQLHAVGGEVGVETEAGCAGRIQCS